MTLARLSADGATFVKAVRCYAAAVLSFAQAMRDFVTAMRNFVAAKYLLESNDEILNRVQDDNQNKEHSMLCPVFYVSDAVA